MKSNFRRNSLQQRGGVSHPRLTVCKEDVLDAAAVEQGMAECDLVVPMAAIGGVDTVLRMRADTMRIRILGTFTFGRYRASGHPTRTGNCAAPLLQPWLGPT